MRASPVVSIHPDQGGSVQVLPPLLADAEVFWAADDVPADVEGGACCCWEGGLFPAWEAMADAGARGRHGGVSVGASGGTMAVTRTTVTKESDAGQPPYKVHNKVRLTHRLSFERWEENRIKPIWDFEARFLAVVFYAYVSAGLPNTVSPVLSHRLAAPYCVYSLAALLLASYPTALSARIPHTKV